LGVLPKPVDTEIEQFLRDFGRDMIAGLQATQNIAE